MISTTLDRVALQDLTDRLLSARGSNLKMVLDIHHRLESLGELDGVEYINDSKATTCSATAYSMSCMESPVIWLLSCIEPLQDMEALRSQIDDKVKSILYIGEENQAFVEQFVNETAFVQHCASMAEMLAEAKAISEEGDVVLFSPASATSDAWANHAARGDAFKAAYKGLS